MAPSSCGWRSSALRDTCYCWEALIANTGLFSHLSLRAYQVDNLCSGARAAVHVCGSEREGCLS